MLATLFTIALAFSTKINFGDSVDAWLRQQAQTHGAHFEKRTVSQPIYFSSLTQNISLLPHQPGGDASQPEITAKNVYSFDRATGKILYQKDAHKEVPMASITKVMTAVVVLDQESDLNKEVKITADGVKVEGSNMALLPGEVLTVRDLLYGLMVNSANDAAQTLAIEVGGGSISNFVRLMNQKAAELGLKNTHFQNPTGLDAENHYSSAYDIGQLADYAFAKPELDQMVSTKVMTVTSHDYTQTRHYLQNTDKLLAGAEGVYAGKTGFTDNAGLCLVSAAKQNGHDVINVVLGSEDRGGDTQKLLAWEFAHYVWK
jgi:D-alanyl-D-alanine carboxypeptidase